MNPNEMKGVNLDEPEMEEIEATCPECGMKQSDWKGQEGAGYKKDMETYCCQECSEGIGCTC